VDLIQDDNITTNILPCTALNNMTHYITIIRPTVKKICFNNNDNFEFCCWWWCRTLHTQEELYLNAIVVILKTNHITGELINIIHY
jgi:hypothetical protein